MADDGHVGGSEGGRAPLDWHELADELNAPARRVRLLTENAIGRAIVQAQPARDARGEIVWSDVG
jgi:hypothetical protein